jgi:hypothetical protein
MKDSAAEPLCGGGAMGRRKERMIAKQDAIPFERSSAVHLGTEVRCGMVGKVENRVQFPGKC